MQKVVLGQIVAPHGVRGDLRIMPLTSNTQLFMDMDYLLLPDERRLQIVKARPHKNIMLVTVKEITSRRKNCGVRKCPCTGKICRSFRKAVIMWAT